MPPDVAKRGFREGVRYIWRRFDTAQGRFEDDSDRLATTRRRTGTGGRSHRAARLARCWFPYRGGDWETFPRRCQAPHQSPLVEAPAYAYAHRHESRRPTSDPPRFARPNVVGRSRASRAGRHRGRGILANIDARAACRCRTWVSRERAEGAGKNSCPKTSKNCSSR